MPGTNRGCIVVTGASTGIGEAVAVRLARQGYRVLAGVRQGVDGERLRESCSAIEPVALDVTNADQLADVSELIRRSEPRGLSGLVNNAGIVVMGPVEGLSPEEWRSQFDVNLLGPVAITTALLPSLLRARGRVVNVSSAAGRIGLPIFGPYAASKFALEGFSDVLRREVGPHGVRVVVVQPGVVSTDVFAKTLPDAEARFANLNPEAEERYRRQIASARRGAVRGPNKGLPPSAVAAVVERAMTARRPRPRYVVGRDAHAAAIASRIVSDRIVDAYLSRMTS